LPFDADKYEVKQVFYTSKDGTRVPMFIAGRKGLKMDGKAPLLMTG
jgi:prolyl oligopeptidase